MFSTERATSPFGRDREIRALGDAIAAAAGGHGQVVLLEGEPGIGKSRLIETASALAQAEGFAIFVGLCDDLVTPRPFAALVEAFGVVPDALEPARAEIAALVGTFDGMDAPDVAKSANPGLQYRAIEALGALVERLAERGPVMLALDDLQWADASTLVALRSISRRVWSLPVVLLGSCRSGHDVADLHRVTDDLLRAGGARLTVGPLDDESVECLIADVLDAKPSDTLLARAQGAGGNPLFVIEFVRSIESPGAVDDPASGTPVEFRLTVLRRLAALPEATTNALRMASVLGATFSPGDLAIALGTSIAELSSTLHPAIVAAIVEDRPPRVGFRHALVRDAIYEHIPEAIRRGLHREIGRALAQAASEPLVVARHLSLGAETEDEEAVEWLRRAGRDVAPRSPGVAVEILERARDLVALTSPVRDEVLADLAVALAWSGRLAEAEALSIEVLGHRPDPSVAGRLRCGLVYALTWQGRSAEALQYTEPAEDERLSDGDAVLLRAEAAVASMWAFDLKTAGRQAANAATEAQRVGHDLAHCHALTVQALVATFAGRPHEAIALARRAVDIADRSPTGEAHLAHPRFFPGLPMLALDQVDEAEDMLRAGLRVADSLGLAWSVPLYHAFLGAKGFIVGDWDGAIAEFEAGLAVADEVGLHVGIIAATSAWLATIQIHRDELEAAEQTLSGALARLATTGPQLGMGPFQMARALLLEARDQNDEALALLQFAWDLFLAGGPEIDVTSTTPAMTDPWSAMALVRLCVKTGDFDRAASLLPSIDHQATSTGTPFMQGQALRCHGLVERDADTLLRAVSLYRSCPRPHELAAACEDAASLLASAARLEEAVPLWDEAVGLYERLGADRDVARVGAQRRQHGVKRGNRRQRVRASQGWESLTETEHKVVVLVAQRLSNPEVAERLFVSRYTVESHLKSIFRKLGVTSRVELATTAVKHGREPVV